MKYTYATDEENITIEQRVDYDRDRRAYILYADVVKREDRGGYIVSTHSPADGLRHIVKRLDAGARASKKAASAAEAAAEAWAYPQALQVAAKNNLKIVREVK